MSMVVLAAMALLALGTYLFRASGSLFGHHLDLSARQRLLLDDAALLLLACVMGTAALLEGHAFAGFARTAGVLVAGVCAWRRAPLPLTLIAAAGTAAGLRLVGIA